MKYVVRFVFYYYDEFDTTLANIYDVVVNTSNQNEAVEVAKKTIEKVTKIYSNPGHTDLVSVTDENGVIYVLSNGQLIVLPEKDYDKLPKTFCFTGETHFIIDGGWPMMCFPE